MSARYRFRAHTWKCLLAFQGFLDGPGRLEAGLYLIDFCLVFFHPCESIKSFIYKIVKYIQGNDIRHFVESDKHPGVPRVVELQCQRKQTHVEMFQKQKQGQTQVRGVCDHISGFILIWLIICSLDSFEQIASWNRWTNNSKLSSSSSVSLNESWFWTSPIGRILEVSFQVLSHHTNFTTYLEALHELGAFPPQKPGFLQKVPASPFRWIGDFLGRGCCAVPLQDSHWSCVCMAVDVETAFVLWYGHRDERMWLMVRQCAASLAWHACLDFKNVAMITDAVMLAIRLMLTANATNRHIYFRINMC